MAIDWGRGATGALKGAAAGSVFGPWGTAIGAGIGGLSSLWDSGDQQSTISSLDPYQQELYRQQYEGVIGQGPFSNLYNYDPEMASNRFEQTIAKPAYRSFQENIVPSITGQFRNKNLMQSSYAGDALSKLARDVQESLNAQRTNYMYGQENQARESKLNAIEALQNRQTFAYDRARDNTGFNIDSILKSINPTLLEKAWDYYHPVKEEVAPAGGP